MLVILSSLFLIGLLILLLVFLFFNMLSLILGAPYLGMNKERLVRVIKLANVKRGEKAVDIGSGDGRIIIALAQKGAVAHGYEINPFYVLLSLFNIYKKGLWGKAFVHWSNFWKIDFSSFDILTVYGISYIMNRLEKKLRGEIKSGARVISSTYSFKQWIPAKEEDNIYLYRQ